MTMTNPDKPITKQDLADFYSKIQPYLGGTAEAGFTPIGTVIAVMGTTAPANYLACDGTVYNISDYRELSDYFYQQFGSKNYFGGDGTTTFAVPDLRGEFLRGTGTNSHTNQGSGANVGVHQDATEHSATWNWGSSTAGLLDLDQGINKDSSPTTKRGFEFPRTIIDNTGIYTYTSRPTNTSVLYCIATKDIYLNPSLDYSTEEKVVGKWIDGSYIYQKTYTGTTPNDNSWHTIINEPNSQFVKWECYIRDGSTVYNKSIDESDSTFRFVAQPNSLVMKSADSLYQNKPYYIIAQYTKSTS